MTMHWKTSPVLAPLVLFCVISSTRGKEEEREQFLGGTLRSEVTKKPDGKYMVEITLLTGWVLGKGPCGQHCTKAVIGRSTLTSRQAMLIAHDPSWLGSFRVDYLQNGTTLQRDVTDKIFSNCTEKVLALSESAGWEQDLLKSSFDFINGTDTFDLNFDGHSWKQPLSLQSLFLDPWYLYWHSQVTVSNRLRSDTGEPNRTPYSFARPLYRIKLGEVTVIRIPAVDGDGDKTICGFTDFVEAGFLSTHPPPNVTVYENCTIYVNASETNGYKNDTWIGVAVSVRDFNREKIVYGTEEFLPYSFSLNRISVQFLVQVLITLSTPVFVDPTLEGNHNFILYAGTTWRTEIYAESPVNTTIAEFSTIVLGNETVMISAPIERDRWRPQVKFVTLSWKPFTSDVGRHIICVQATDNTSEDSVEMRCFILTVLADTFNYSTIATPGKPYFVNIPSPDQYVSCNLETTCIVPLYIRGNAEVTEVRVERSNLDENHLGPIELVNHRGDQMYKTDFSFAHSLHGNKSVCFRAKDIIGILSEEVCIKIKIQPPNPCESSPCKNGGTCQFNEDTVDFGCFCGPKYSGRHCELKDDPCKPNPCILGHGWCIGMAGILCYCRKGWEGLYCERNIDDCSPKSCHHGTCTDLVNDYMCSCEAGYTGKNCSTDINDCLPNPCRHGTCTDQVDDYLCTCEKGYYGKNCSSDTDDCSPDPCKQGTCTQMVHGYSCLCDAGYTGKNCSTDINDCSPNPCQHGTCTDMVNDYSCSCEAGYTGKNCSTNIDDCLPNPCHYGTCTDMVNDYLCSCESGYTGKNCSTDINDCLPNPCQHGTCTDRVNDYLCICEAGYTGKNCSIDINDCLPNPCHYGTCIDQVNDYLCICEAGYTGKNCSTDIDDCLPNPCRHGTCTDRVDDYLCSCEAGYTGKNCSTDINDCSPNPCHHGTCTDRVNDYLCSCEAGYTGKNCSTVTNGYCNASICLNGGVCVNEVCKCPEGFGGDHCERVSNPCNPSPCERGVCYHHQMQYHCLCPTGYTGKRCEINIDDCLPQPCLNGGVCRDGIQQFSCTCVTGFTGHNCETDIDECASQPCLNGGFCTDSLNRYFCQCQTGFQGDRCENVEDPCIQNPCRHGICFSHESDFLCECPPHFTGKLCEKSVQLELAGSVVQYMKTTAGLNFALNCSSDSTSSQITYEWSKVHSCGGSIEKFNDSVFHRRNVSIGDSGNYTCKAKGVDGTTVIHVFHVEITTRQEVDKCTFDDGALCRWTQYRNDSFDWAFQSGTTLTEETGPDNDHTLGTGQGKYLYLESSSPRLFGEYASLISQLLPANHTLCFEFWYFMYGDGIGRLRLHIQDSCSQKELELLKVEGDQGMRWIKASRTVLASQVPNDYRLVITADVGSTYKGDIAIDDLTLYDGACKDNPGNVPMIG